MLLPLLATALSSATVIELLLLFG